MKVGNFLRSQNHLAKYFIYHSLFSHSVVQNERKIYSVFGMVTVKPGHQVSLVNFNLTYLSCPMNEFKGKLDCCL